ncbi:hypothetical protein F5Y09DRAFT_351192 [Xylaria sp. FL1042]|nr:hypothetical protein F5Y09DRAFT_351192 [Xylaria sp. FL1042]
MPPKNKNQMSRTNVLVAIDATIQIKDRWPRKDKLKGPPDLPTDFYRSGRIERCLDALQLLQLRRNEYLLEDALAVPLEFLHESLPYMVQRDVNIFQPTQRDIWGLELGGDFDRLDTELSGFIERHEEALSGRRYHFWPIDVSRGSENGPPHWALIVLHLTHDHGDGDGLLSPKDTQEEPYNFLFDFAVIDPEHGNAARELEDEMATILKHVLPKMGITVGTTSVRENTWVPPSLMNPPQLTSTGEKENWSSGLRVFEMIRVWLDRITDHYCRNPHDHDWDNFWAAHPGWFNVDAVRSSMVGMAATMVNRAMKSTTRIAIEPILDKAMRHAIDGHEGLTQTMMPDRRSVGAFIPNQSRKHPSWIKDTPLDRENGGDDAEETGEGVSADANEGEVGNGAPEGEQGAAEADKEAEEKSPEKKINTHLATLQTLLVSQC